MRDEVEGAPAAPETLGEELAERLLAAGADRILEEVRGAASAARRERRAGAPAGPGSRELRRSRPLTGRTVVVTRPREQAAELAGALEDYGATVLLAPAIEIVPVAIGDEWRQAAAGLASYDLVIFTSANGVRWFVDRLDEAGSSPGALAGRELVAIGPATAAALNVRGLDAAVVPDDYVAEGVLAALAVGDRSLDGARVLIPRAREARATLPDGLRARGARVEVLTVYETLPAAALAVPVGDILAADYVTFTSSSTVNAFLGLIGTDPGAAGAAPTHVERLAGVRLASIGPVTSATLARHGLAVAVEATKYTAAGLAAAIAADAAAVLSNDPPA